jgi:hypothetical protein
MTIARQLVFFLTACSRPPCGLVSRKRRWASSHRQRLLRRRPGGANSRPDDSRSRRHRDLSHRPQLAGPHSLHSRSWPALDDLRAAGPDRSDCCYRSREHSRNCPRRCAGSPFQVGLRGTYPIRKARPFLSFHPRAIGPRFSTAENSRKRLPMAAPPLAMGST